MLWGGLLLIVGALLPLLFVGRRVLRVSALLTGIGVGLFIDEIGKFITESNDYFFSPAAPLIYGGVLLLVLLWLMVRRNSRSSPEAALQAAAEALQIGIDGQLTAGRRERVSASLREADTALPPDDVALGERILAALESPEIAARLAAPGWTARNHPSALSARLLPTSVERVVILVGLAWNVLLAVLATDVLLAVLATDVLLASDEIGSVSSIPQPEGRVEIPTEPLWQFLLLGIGILVSIVSLAALLLLLRGRPRQGTGVAIAAMLIGLVGAGLLTIYVVQFGALTSTVLHVILLAAIIDYRGRMGRQGGRSIA